MHYLEIFLFLFLVKPKECTVVIENTEWRALQVYITKLDTVTTQETYPGISLSACGNIASTYIFFYFVITLILD